MGFNGFFEWFKIKCLSIYSYCTNPLILYIFCIPFIRLLNYGLSGFINPLVLVFLTIVLCFFFDWLFLSYHIILIKYWAMKLFFYTEKFWLMSYKVLLQHYKKFFIIHLLIIFFVFYCPFFQIVYISLYCLYIIYNLLFFQVFFTLKNLNYSNIKSSFILCCLGRLGPQIYVRVGTDIVNLENQFLVDAIFRYGLDFESCKYGYQIIRLYGSKDSTSYSRSLLNIDEDKSPPFCVPYKNYKWFAFLSSISIVLGLFFIRFVIFL